MTLSLTWKLVLRLQSKGLLKQTGAKGTTAEILKVTEGELAPKGTAESNGVSNVGNNAF